MSENPSIHPLYKKLLPWPAAMLDYFIVRSNKERYRCDSSHRISLRRIFYDRLILWTINTDVRNYEKEIEQSEISSSIMRLEDDFNRVWFLLSEYLYEAGTVDRTSIHRFISPRVTHREPGPVKLFPIFFVRTTFLRSIVREWHGTTERGSQRFCKDPPSLRKDISQNVRITR